MPRSNVSQFKLAVLCGGSSAERGISLNSARSVCDHLGALGVALTVVYFDVRRRPHLIPRNWLYSNTPSDFDFKLGKGARLLSGPALKKILAGVDLAFPVMHGKFGEDGGIQSILEKFECPFVGPSASACQKVFDKHRAQNTLRDLGFFSLPGLCLESLSNSSIKAVEQFFRQHRIKRAIVKPTMGGSSIGVYSVSSPAEALARAKEIVGKRLHSRILIEPYCTGREFTAVILQNRFGLPVCLMPIEIETDYSNHQILDYRKKYLPTRQATYHCPPRFDDESMLRIQTMAEQLFAAFGMRDFSRFDGWLLEDGRIWFSDFNPISGMEQNSFMFIQAARLGMSHRDVLAYIVSNAAARHGLDFDPSRRASEAPAKTVHVLFGGKTAERQVSVMSGTNAWLKLQQSERFNPKAFFLDAAGAVWQLPYALALNHTAEDIADACVRAQTAHARDAVLRKRVLQKLAVNPAQLSQSDFLPRKMSLEKFLAGTDFLLIGLHGGIGEDGTLQRLCDRHGVRYSGSSPEASRICMDKFETGLRIEKLKDCGVYSAARIRRPLASLKKVSLSSEWQTLVASLDGPPIVAKPPADGCSAGVVILESERDLRAYLSHLFRGKATIAAGVLAHHSQIIEMPTEEPSHLLFERFIATDKIQVRGDEVRWSPVSGWIEVTIGLLGRGGRMKAFCPSLTVASGHILSVEEKFQGGTGINLTPPPAQFVSSRAVTEARARAQVVAKEIGLEGYARIDAFMNIKTGELMVIEVNTLPAITPSTVIFHQALAEPHPIPPVQLLERIVELGLSTPRKRTQR